MPKIFGKQIGTVVRAPRGVSKSTPKKVGKHLNTLMDRGSKVANAGSRHGTATPGGFGGAKTLTRYGNAPVRRGGGANKGAGDTTGFDI